MAATGLKLCSSGWKKILNSQLMHVHNPSLPGLLAFGKDGNDPVEDLTLGLWLWGAKMGISMCAKDLNPIVSKWMLDFC